MLAQPVHAEGRDAAVVGQHRRRRVPAHGPTSSDLLRNANAALYRAKNGGRNRVELFDGDDADRARGDARRRAARCAARSTTARSCRSSSPRSTRRPAGSSAPSCWPAGCAATARVVGAAEFIALAQARRPARAADRADAHRRPARTSAGSPSLGLPDGLPLPGQPRPRRRPTLSWRDDPIDELVRGIDPTLLTVDVRESAVADDLPDGGGDARRVPARGGRVCLDDFARGVSSLSLLRQLPIDEVRIDRQAIDTITAHPHDRAIVRSIIAVVREIGLSVTADGVETGAQADALIALGCVRQQGHLYARALPAEAFETYLVERWPRATSPACRSPRRPGRARLSD